MQTMIRLRTADVVSLYRTCFVAEIVALLPPVLVVRVCTRVTPINQLIVSNWP